MEKIVRDGMVAVAVSPGYGAGWSTWTNINPMDARLNQLFLDGKVDEVVRICEDKSLGYAGGAGNVVIEWLPVGTRFVIEEYDGSESLMTIDDFGWQEA
jgi:hypothetical protein